MIFSDKIFIGTVEEIVYASVSVMPGNSADNNTKKLNSLQGNLKLYRNTSGLWVFNDGSKILGNTFGNFAQGVVENALADGKI